MLASGVVDWPWWGYAPAALVLTHVTVAAVTLFLHRHQVLPALALADFSLPLRRYAGA